jgi:uroporphyrinogen decarboxylase
LGENPIPVIDGDWEAREEYLRQRIRFYQMAGYDFVIGFCGPNLLSKRLTTDDTAILPRSQRSWVNETEGIISTMEDFEKYPWPSPESVDYFDQEFISQNLPEGMKMIATTSGILEWVMWLMGFTPFSIALYEQPDLIEAMFQKIGDLYASIFRTIVDIPNVGAVMLGDDMGYKTGTFFKPEQMRHYVFPRQKRLVEYAHRRGLPFILHACGNLRAIMDDLIDYVGIDAKHSFEDVYMSAAEAKQIYGDRIAILGGVDMDMISRFNEDEVRAYTRQLLEACMPGGGYALGTGNTAANYVPVNNYLAMLEEGMKCGYYGF